MLSGSDVLGVLYKTHWVHLTRLAIVTRNTVGGKKKIPMEWKITYICIHSSSSKNVNIFEHIKCWEKRASTVISLLDTTQRKPTQAYKLYTGKVELHFGPWISQLWGRRSTMNDSKMLPTGTALSPALCDASYYAYARVFSTSDTHRHKSLAIAV